MAAVGGYAAAGAPARGLPVHATEPTNDLVELCDGYDGAAVNGRWSSFQGGGTITESVASNEHNLTCNAGGAGQSFWFDTNQGILKFQNISGNFQMIDTVRVRNLADSGLPTVGDGNFRIAGIAAHDPNRAVNLNYVHLGLGCTASAGIQAEWKTTVNSVSTFNSVAAATGIGQLRMDRKGQIFDLYYRATVDAAWTLVQSIDRSASPMPLLLQVGRMVYASVAGHDERIFTRRTEIRRL